VAQQWLKRRPDRNAGHGRPSRHGRSGVRCSGHHEDHHRCLNEALRILGSFLTIARSFAGDRFRHSRCHLIDARTSAALRSEQEDIARWNNCLCKVFPQTAKPPAALPTALPSSPPYVPFSWTASCGLSKLGREVVRKPSHSSQRGQSFPRMRGTPQPRRSDHSVPAVTLKTGALQFLQNVTI